MTLGRNAVGYLTNRCTALAHLRLSASRSPASPTSEYKKKLAKKLAGVDEADDGAKSALSAHQGRMFPEGEND